MAVPQDAYPPAKQALRKALELDEKNCSAHSELHGLVGGMTGTGKPPTESSGMPWSYAPTMRGFMAITRTTLGWNGRGPEALAEIEKARELDPLLFDALRGKALVNFHLRNYKLMIEVGRECVASDANSWIAHYLLGVGRKVQAKLAGPFLSIRRLSSYRKAIRILSLHWRTPMQLQGERQRRRKSSTNAAPIGNQLCFALYDCNGLRSIGRQRQSLRIPRKGVSGKILRPSLLFEGRPEDRQPALGSTLPGSYAPDEFPELSQIMVSYRAPIER